MNLFYTSRVSTDQEPSELVLEGQEAIHASKVIRLREGDTLHATDGRGRIYSGAVSRLSKARVLVEIGEVKSRPRPRPEVVIALGLIRKRDRLEFAIEKGVEMGVTRFVIFPADRSEKRTLRLDRLEMTALSAMKQSLRSWLPAVEEADNLESVLDRFDGVKCLVADETLQQEESVPASWKTEAELLFLVGPEGGFSVRERDLLESEGVERMSLGSGRLRSETAVMAIAGLFRS